MAVSAILRFTDFWVRFATDWFQDLRRAGKFAAAASVGVACAAMYLSVIISTQIKESAVQRAGADAALYMDSFVASHVQELTTQNTLSEENREALERLLSPASMHRSIVAFRIWKSDTIVFSNERALIGKTFARTQLREQALQGQIAVEFEHPEGDDDEQVRSLKVPVLEVYAPVRQKGTGRIIAIAETYEIAVELTNEVWINQVATWVSAFLIVLTIDLLLFALVGTGRRERSSLVERITEVSRQHAQGEERRHRITNANMKIAETNERSLRRVETDLQQGPLQNVTVALLKLDPVHWAVSQDENLLRDAVDCKENVLAAREALIQALRQMHGVCSAAVPAQVAELSPRETLALTAREHHRRTGLSVEYDLDALPQQLPLALKTCLYRIALEALHSTATTVQPQVLRGSLRDNSVTLEIVGGTGGRDQRAMLASVQDRIEALGGRLDIHCTPGGQLALIGKFDLADMGITVE